MFSAVWRKSPKPSSSPTTGRCSTTSSPSDRKQYVETVHRLLVPGGKYLSVCFSEKDAGFGGTGKERRTPLGTVLYFSSEDELRDLFGPYFDITTSGDGAGRRQTGTAPDELGFHEEEIGLRESSECLASK